MIIGYWDKHGYPDLYAGNPDVYDASTKSLISSAGHIAQAGGHNTSGCTGVENSLSCYMNTDPVTGGSSTSGIVNGLDNYATSKGYNFDAQALTNEFSENFSFDDYKAEIDAGRPVEILVLKTGAGHAVTGIGYEDNAGTANDFYVLHDTWSLVDQYGAQPGGEPSGGKQVGAFEYWRWDPYVPNSGEYTVFGGVTFTAPGVPEPSTIILLIFSGLILFYREKKFSPNLK